MRNRIDMCINQFSYQMNGADVQWLKGDINQPDTYKEALKTVDAAVSCVGAFGSNDVSVKCKRIIEMIMKTLHIYRSLWKGSMEMQILLLSKPLSNKVGYAIFESYVSILY